MVKNVSIKSRGKKILKLKGNSQSEIVGGQVSFLFLFFSCVFFRYKLCRLLYCQVINDSNNNTDRTAASESLGTKAKGINYRK